MAGTAGEMKQWKNEYAHAICIIIRRIKRSSMNPMVSWTDCSNIMPAQKHNTCSTRSCRIRACCQRLGEYSAWERMVATKENNKERREDMCDVIPQSPSCLFQGLRYL